VIASRKASPNPAAREFTEIAAVPGASELSLWVLLQSELTTMPQIRMPADQLNELVGYIMSLKPRQ